MTFTVDIIVHAMLFVNKQFFTKGQGCRSAGMVKISFLESPCYRGSMENHYGYVGCYAIEQLLFLFVPHIKKHEEGTQEAMHQRWPILNFCHNIHFGDKVP